uniref:Uncharacterized protein n=1 Tax=Fagus sylvatica TaxID=28930 RepID=A0A2N9FV59_FAGSY
MRHIVGKLSTSSFQRYKVCANRSSDEGVMAPGSRGVGAVFVHSSDADSGQTGNAIGEPRVPRRSRSHYLSNAPGLADQLVASRKDSAREGGSCAAYFCKVPDLRKSELGLVRYGPANRGHRGVFGPFEGSFPIGIPAGPDKFLAIREFHVVHGCVFFPMCPGSQINLLRVRKTLCASVDNVGGEIPELSAKPYFVGLFSRAWPCTEASLGSQDMILRTEAVGMFLMPRGVVSSIQFLVWSMVRSNLGQTWSTLVKLGQTWSKLSKLLEMYPGPHFKGFWVRWVLVGLETARSNLGQTLVNSSQTWSTLVKLGQTLGNVSRTFFLGVFEVMSPRRNRPTWFGLPRFACRHPRKSRGRPESKKGSPPLSPLDEIRSNRAISGQTILDENYLRKAAFPDNLNPGEEPPHILTRDVVETHLGGNVCAKILSDPLQLGPRAKTLRQEVHFSYHMQLSDRQELLRSSRNLSQKMTPWHKEHSDGLRSQDHILRTQSSPLCKACTVKKVFLTRNKLICEPGHIGKKTHPCTTWNSRIAKNFIGRKLSDGTKNVKIRHRELGQICARTGTRFEKKRAGSKTHFFSRTAAFARRVFPARNKLIREPGCVGKIMTPATTWNSRFADSIPRLTGICIGKVHKNSSDTPTSGSHNSLVRTPIRANFISLERGRRELSEDMPHDPF